MKYMYGFIQVWKIRNREVYRNDRRLWRDVGTDEVRTDQQVTQTDVW